MATFYDTIRDDLTAYIESFAESMINLETVKDLEDTENAIEQMEKVVFSRSAVVLGDLVTEIQTAPIGYHKYYADFDILVCVKAQKTKAVFDSVVDDVVRELDRSNLDEDSVITSIVLNVSELRKITDKISYSVIKYRIIGMEAR